MLLTDEFISRYEGIEPMKPLGSFVYYRTYSRWIPELNRRETWLETARRAVEYNCSLSSTTTREEAEELFDNVFNLRSFLSGRTFWIGGSSAVSDHPLANFNCSGIVLDKFEKLKELFYALMVGTGVGFRVMPEDTEKLPKLRNVRVLHKNYEARAKYNRAESTSLRFIDFNTHAIIHIGDSKEGWTQALGFFFDIVTKNEYRHIETITLDYDSVRPKGERLKRFGGTASGHESIQNMFSKIDKVIKKKFENIPEDYVSVESIDMLDFANIIAENVVVGGVRRSAEIGLIGINDQKCIQAKNDLYTQVENGIWSVNQDILHRQLSNNTIIHWEKPSREFWHWQFQQMRYSGEPAFYNGEQALKRNPNFKLTNPCAEVILDDQQTCNLVTLNVMAFVENGKLSISKLMKAQRLNARASYRMTLLELELPEWNYKLHRDRLLGVSLTGWQDMVNATGINKSYQQALLEGLKNAARNGADEIADELGLNRSLLVTTVKPEGTLALLPTVSSGLHFSHSPYYIRRIRINSDDALAKVCISLDYPVYPEVGQQWSNARTLVIEFPVKAPEGRTKYDVSALEQLRIYKMFMESYVDHNASITVSIRDHEWDDVEQWVYDNWDSCIGISFLALDDSYFKLLPYEAISEEEYYKRFDSMKPFNAELLAEFEKPEEHELDSDTGCSNGVCPLR